MICGRQGLRIYKYKDKYKNNRHAYDIICFWKGDDNTSLIMKNVQNMQNKQNMQNMQNMQISPNYFFHRKSKNLRSLNQNQVSTRGPV